MSDVIPVDPAGEWFAVQVWAGRESISAQHLTVRGHEVFLPTYRNARQWSDRVKVVERALFMGYLFCRSARASIGHIITAPGVIRIVGYGSQPTPIANDTIHALQRVAQLRLGAEPYEFLRVNDRVRITHGPLSGCEGIVLSTQRRRRLIISVELLQRAVAVELDPSWVCVSASADDGHSASTALLHGNTPLASWRPLSRHHSAE